VKVGWQVYQGCLEGGEVKVVVMVEDLVITLGLQRERRGRRLKRWKESFPNHRIGKAHLEMEN
jgi:hypothetical protein